MKIDIDFTFLGIAIILIWYSYIGYLEDTDCMDRWGNMTTIVIDWWIDETNCKLP